MPWWSIFNRELIVESVDINDWAMVVEQFADGRHTFPRLVPERPGPPGPRRFVTTVRVVRASRVQTFVKLKVPNALPFVFAGLDIAIVFSVLGAIVGEFVGAQRGLGNLILQFNFGLDIAGVFAVMILLSIMGVALHLVMQFIQKRVIFWAEPEQVIGA